MRVRALPRSVRGPSFAPVGAGPNFALGRAGPSCSPAGAGPSFSPVDAGQSFAPVGTGAELIRTLQAGVEADEAIRVFDNCFALDLITASDEPGTPCLGAITHHPRYGLQMIWARTTILAAGGAGVLWRETSNPPASTGDALAMAWRAGAELSDLAFEQFHPTTLYVAGGDRALISEAVRGEGAHLLDGSGERVMVGVHERAELAPRDVVSASIYNVLRRSGAPHVWLDARHVGGFAERFPWIHSRLTDFGVDPASDLIPVNPAAHYSVGGLRAGVDGTTSVPGLLAVGEASCTGLHGANRLASNSLLEALVCGRAAGRTAGEVAQRDAATSIRHVPVVSQISERRPAMIDLTDIRSSLRSVMWRSVGIVREPEHLADVCEMCDFWARYTLDKVFDDPFAWETQNLLTLGAMVARSASWRRESRGCHRREDVDGPRDEFRVHDVWVRGVGEVRTEPGGGGVPA